MLSVGVIGVIILLIALRFLVPPVPTFLTRYSNRWGGRITIALCTIGLAVGTLAAFLFRR